MKHLALFFFLSMALFALDKQIIIGSYLHQANSITELKELSLHVEQDKRLNSLIEKNNLKTKSNQIGKYYVVSILPLTDYVQLLRTLKSLKKYYPDAYVLDVSALPIFVEPKVKNIEVEKVKEVVSIVAPQKPVIKIEQNTTKKSKVSPLEPKQKEELKENKNYLLMLLVLLIIAIAIYIRKKAKKEE